jgi:Asp/Glu/hydantoin racemase
MSTASSRVVIVGPTSAPWADIAASVEDDLRALRRPGVDISYVTTGAGPESIRNAADEEAAAPHVVDTVRRLADACDAIVVDCTGDPGLVEARSLVAVPVVGAGEAARHAAARSPSPVMWLSGDDVRGTPLTDLIERTAGSATVVVDATGQRDVVEALRAATGLLVIEPLEAAVERCIEILNRPRPTDAAERR